PVEITVDGIVTIAKDSSAFTNGAPVYWDNTALKATSNISNASGPNTLIGVASLVVPVALGFNSIGATAGTAALGGATGDATVQVRLNGTFGSAPSLGSLLALGQEPLVADIAPEFIYGTARPLAASGTPTIAQCTTLVNALAPLVAQYTLDASIVLRCVYKATGAAGLFGGTVYVTPTGALSATSSGNTSIGSASTLSATEAVPVDVVIATPALIRELAWRLAFQLASSLDGKILNLYASFITNAPIGTGGQGNLTTTNLGSIITLLTGLGEPIFVVIHPETLVGSLYTVASSAVIAPSLIQGRYNSLRVLVSDQVKTTGSSPVVWHGIAFTPSAIGFGSEVQAPTNDSTHAQTVGTYTPSLDGAQAQLSVLLAITNNGSGNQTVTASCIAATGILTGANGVQVNA
ncbi:MAG TPA: capsid cement protein, partial [Candidatus Acidoferrum sp.]|nr:capsid cement protein [Candidatus Acidoferrum sp.]